MFVHIYQSVRPLNKAISALILSAWYYTRFLILFLTQDKNLMQKKCNVYYSEFNRRNSPMLDINLLNLMVYLTKY